MGDGRYYTTEQFYEILFLMLLLTALVIVITNLFYRNRQKSKGNRIILILSLISGITLVHFLEAVVYSPQAGLFFKWIEVFCLFGILSMMIFCFSSGHRSWDILATLYFCTFLFSFIYPGGSHLISEYSLNGIQYGRFFGILQLAGMILCITAIGFARPKNGKLPQIVMFTALILPLVYNTMIILMKGSSSGYVFGFFLSVTLVYYVMLNRLPSQIMPRNLDKIEKWLNEGIIITNESGNITFTNLLEHSWGEILEIPKKLNVEKPSEIFKNVESAMQEADGVAVTVSGLEPKTFFVTKTQLFIKKRRMGYLFVIKETTEMTQLLLELKNKNLEHEKKNQALKDYARVAYKYETEKEINLLTNEMNDNIGHQMIELSMVCQKACLEVEQNSKDAPEAIQATVKLSQKVLNSVRKAVSAYRSLYKRG